MDFCTVLCFFVKCEKDGDMNMAIIAKYGNTYAI